MTEVKLALDTALLEMGLQKYVMWDYAKYPNLLVLGNTGSGKSYALRLLIARIAMYIPHSKAWLCDFKNEFMKPSENARFFGYKAVTEGFTEFEQMFYDRLNGNPDKSFRLLLIDEYIAWLNSLDKKEADEIKKRMASMLQMVRSKNCHIILGCQRGMAENFSFGSRDCLNVIFLGAPSKESLHSFVSSEEAAIMKPCNQGTGYACFDGKLPIGITIPTIRSAERMNDLLTSIVTR